MPVARRFAYLDHAATAPISGPASEAVEAWLRQAAELGGAAWPEWEESVQQVRRTAADLIGAAADEVALVPNTTAGINLVAEGFPWRDGDNVVTLANEFPSNQYPWMNLAGRGVETRRVPVEDGRVDLDRLADACDGRTRVVSVSWIGYASGWRMDLETLVALAHARGALVFLDAIQGLGVFPMNVRRVGVDFLAADGHKWLLGPEGAGLLFVRREQLSLLRPLSIGWNSVVDAYDFSRIELTLRPDAARYEGGSRNMVGHLALGASLRLLASLGLGPDSSALADRVLAVTDLAVRRLEAIGAEIRSCRDPQHRSGILAFAMPGRDPADLRRRCLQADVVLSVRGGNLRISPHAYNDESDLERLIECLR
ncbi:MAG: aminotransferase class V-fold PLP-dependent enzyme [Candidatus Anammoximicrobium sp.]|nr:aminotransferase class V-fold PLP-dependent enzyme [Candidatus Anammoximicrobium sp.]